MSLIYLSLHTPQYGTSPRARAGALNVLTSKPDAMPPRRPLERAVAQSPLFRLPIEIRLVLYKQLLVSRGPITISHTKQRRHWQNEQLRYFTCKHQYNHSKPKLATSFLFTCRLLYQESSPVLYHCNTIHFDTPQSAMAFRWCADSTRAAFVPDISICICMGPYHCEWQNYISEASRVSTSLGTDFVHVKRLTIRLRRGIQFWYTMSHLQKSFNQSFRNLEWVRLLGVVRGSDISMFMPLVDQGTFENVQTQVKNVQVEIIKWKHEMLRGWELVTLWWGSSSDQSPYRIHPIDDLEHERNLVREGREEFERVRATGRPDVLRLFPANPS